MTTSVAHSVLAITRCSFGFMTGAAETLTELTKTTNATALFDFLATSTLAKTAKFHETTGAVFNQNIKSNDGVAWESRVASSRVLKFFAAWCAMAFATWNLKTLLNLYLQYLVVICADSPSSLRSKIRQNEGNIEYAFNIRV